MKLRQVQITRMPGISTSFSLDALPDGLNIVVGANGIGKSRLCAAVRGMLWHDRFAEPRLIASATFQHDDAAWRVERGGSRHRWQRNGVDTEPPPLPPLQLDGCFFLGLRDLLDDGDTAGRDLAGRIRRQMSGGFDLDAVVRELGTPLTPRAGRNEKKAVEAADSAIRRAVRDQREAAEKENRLEHLIATASDAAAARQRLGHFDVALNLGAERQTLQSEREAFAQLPPALERLDGRELADLDNIQKDLADKRRELKAEEALVHEYRDETRGTGLKCSIDESALSEQRERISALRQHERDLASARQDEAAAHQAVLTRRANIGLTTETGPGAGKREDELTSRPAALTWAADTRLFDLLRDTVRHDAARAAVNERLALLADVHDCDEDRRQIATLRRGIGLLRDWLRAPDADARDAQVELWPSRAALLTVGAILICSGLAIALLALLAAPGAWALATDVSAGLMGVGISAVGIAMLMRATLAGLSGVNQRMLAERDFPASLVAPSTWSPAHVSERLVALEDEVAQRDATVQLVAQRAAERQEYEGRQGQLAAAGDALQAQRAELARDLGLAPTRPVVEMVDLAHMLKELRDASTGLERAGARCRRLELAVTTQLEPITKFLETAGENRPEDGAAALGGLESLERRSRHWGEATQRTVLAQRARDKITAEVAALEARERRVFAAANLRPGDRPGLARLLVDHGQHGRLRRSIGARESTCARLLAELEERQEAALADLDAETLEQQRSAHQKRADELEEINQEIGAIRARAEDARRGRQVEDAIAARDAALIALRERRDQVLDAAAATFLIDEVRHEHESHQSPRVLKRARAHFEAFTHQRYALAIDPGQDGSFIAVDQRTEQGLRLSELSDGTRAQLILAARMAFAEEAGKGAKLPLFLDEALDHSDPERFHAIARSMARMILSDDLQVFYLSNDPTDIDRFRVAFEEENCTAINILDLGLIRDAAQSLGNAAALEVAPLASVPHPEGASPEAYGAALGVAPLDPVGDALAHPVYYLLRDELPLLYTLLQARLSTIGQCRNLLAGDSDLRRQIVAHSPTGTSLTARIDLFEIFCLAWREGRGIPVRRADLEAAGAVSGTFIDAVVDVARELNDDGERLIGALRTRGDKRLSGFRKSAIDKLEQYFLEHGHIASQPVLSETALIERTVSTPAASRLARGQAAELTALWWRLAEQARQQ